MLVKNLFFKKDKGVKDGSTQPGRPKSGLRTDQKNKKPDRCTKKLEDVQENSCLAQIPKDRLKALDQFQESTKNPTAGGRRRTANPMMRNQARLSKFTNFIGSSKGTSTTDIQNRIRRRSMFPAGKGAEAELDRRQKRQNASRNIRKKKKKVEYNAWGEKFVLYDYYTPTGMLGSGAYASVCAALNKRTGRIVAIKKNKKVFQQLSDAKRILREVKLLSFFDHDDVVGLIDVIVPNEDEMETFEDVYLVLQKMEMNLSKVIRSVKLTNRHFQFLVYQMFRGLKYIHSAGVIHRDLKPANILVNGSDCNLKITDFGLSRGVCKEEDCNLTEYVVTRWYRAPEVMCSAKQYDEKVDVWSVGCIFAEMILRKPLFPGGNHLEQLRIIFEILGTPTCDNLDWIKTPEAKNWVKGMKQYKGHSLDKVFHQATPDALDLLKRMLLLDPEKRISVDEALAHPYFSEQHNPAKEVTCKKFDISFEYEKSINTKFGVRHMMCEELKNFKKNYKAKRARKKKQKAVT